MNISWKNTIALLAGVTTLLWFGSRFATDSDAECLPSDYLIENATIYTADDDKWTADSLAVLGERIVFVGTSEEATQWRCGTNQVIDLDGATVFPGFTDSHQHLEGVGRRTRTLSLFGIETLVSTIDAIESWADQVDSGDWVLGRGWIEREWTDEQRFLTRHDVDGFTVDKPLYLPRADGVSALVNSKALAMAGINEDTPDPLGGLFHRDDNGELTGYVLGKAMDPFRAILPSDTDAYLKENLKRGMRANAELGWTQTHDAGMSWRLVNLLRELYEEGEMSHRVYIAMPISEADVLFDQGKERSADDWFALRGIKVFIDGTLGSRGAALIEPYADADTSGFMNRTTYEQLMPVLDQALRQGVQIMTHVIGDRALRQTLDWYEEAKQALPADQWESDDLRWRLEHAQIIQPDDQERLLRMQVTPSMQPSHAIGDLNFAPARLGRERLQYAYPWQDLIDKGLKIVAGSDAPVELGDPRIEFYAAITRARLDGTRGEGWHPELAVSRADALRMFTVWPAYSAFQEQDRGSIAVGKYADLSIFDTNFMTADPQAILQAQTVMTVVGGTVVFDSR